MHRFRIFSERQKASTKQQARRAVFRLKRKRLTKSGDRFGVLAAQLSNDAEVMIDEGMFDSLPKRRGKHFGSGFKITGLQGLNARGEFCLQLRRHVPLCKCPGRRPEKEQENDPEAEGFPTKHAPYWLRPVVRHGDSFCESRSGAGVIRAYQMGKGAHEASTKERGIV